MSADDSFPNQQENLSVGSEDSTSKKGTAMLVALVVLAVVASIVMLFSHSDAAMKIAVLAALWAAFLGLFLVARYRTAAENERARSREQQARFAEELRAEQQRFAESQASAGALQDSKDTELLEEIREQLTQLRAQLEELSGRSLGYEPQTLLAEARRVQELEASVNQAAAGVDSRFGTAYPLSQETPETANYEPAPVAAETQFEGLGRYARPAEAADDTVVIPQVAEVIAAEEQPEEQPEELGKNRFSTGSFAAIKLQEPEFTTAKHREPEQEQAPEVTHGRRRRDERSDSVSVAELLANLKQK